MGLENLLPFKINAQINDMANYPYRKKLTLSGTGKDETDYIFKLNVHRGFAQGDMVGTDIFLDNRCKTDFSDVRFLDADGNSLEYYLPVHGNYEILYDNNKVGDRAIIRDGAIYTSNLRDKDPGLYKSVDNGYTYKKLTPDGVTDVELVFIDSNGYIYINKDTYLFQRSTDNGATWETTLDFTASNGFIKRKNMAEDSQGNLFIGRYQDVGYGVVVYKSTNKGDTWDIVYEINDDSSYYHIHGVMIDPSTDYVYIGIDGSDSAHKKLVRSVDHGVNWADIWSGEAADVVTCLFMGNKRFFAGGNTAKRCSLHVTTDDVTFTPLLPTGASIQDLQVLGNHIYAMGTCVDGNMYAQLYQLDLDGSNARTIWTGSYDTATNFCGFFNADVGTPTASIERQLLLGIKQSEGNRTYVRGRLYEGGQHYQATFHIKFRELPAEGTDIFVVCGNSSAQSQSNLEIYPNPGIAMPNPLLRMLLNEGEGTQINDISGNGRNGVLTHIDGKGSWDTVQGRRIGHSYPWIFLPGNSYKFSKGDYVTIPTDDDLEQLNKDFTIIAWIKSTSMTQPQNIFAKGSGNNIFAFQMRGTGFATGIMYSNGTGTAVRGGFSFINNGEWHMVGVMLTNDSTPSAKFILDGRIRSPYALSYTPIVNNELDFRIGADLDGNNPFEGNICDLMVYPYQLTPLQVAQLYENRMLADTEPAVLTTLT